MEHQPGARLNTVRYIHNIPARLVTGIFMLPDEKVNLVAKQNAAHQVLHFISLSELGLAGINLGIPRRAMGTHLLESDLCSSKGLQQACCRPRGIPEAAAGLGHKAEVGVGWVGGMEFRAEAKGAKAKTWCPWFSHRAQGPSY